MILSPNAQEHHCKMMQSIFMMKVNHSFRKYLGLPIQLDKSSAQAFDPLVEKVQWKMQGWKAKLLSPGGRLLLINNVTAALCHRSLSTYQILAITLLELNILIMNFF